MLSCLALRGRILTLECVSTRQVVCLVLSTTRGIQQLNRDYSTGQHRVFSTGMSVRAVVSTMDGMVQL